jgi:hypothetical protein
VNEAEVRAALAGWGALSVGGAEAWIADQEWQATPDGWIVAEQWQGWSFDLEAVASGVRITSSPSSGTPAVWVVPI